MKQVDKWDDIRTSISFLISILYKHYNQPVILIIDEYDTPLDAAYVTVANDSFLGDSLVLKIPINSPPTLFSQSLNQFL